MPETGLSIRRIATDSLYDFRSAFVRLTPASLAAVRVEWFVPVYGSVLAFQKPTLSEREVDFVYELSILRLRVAIYRYPAAAFVDQPQWSTFYIADHHRTP